MLPERDPGGPRKGDEPFLVSVIRRTDQAVGLFEAGETVLVGMSGGHDSVALVDALRLYAPERRLSLCIAHLDHMLRPDSAADAAYVAHLAAEWDLPAFVETWDVGQLAAESGRGLEEAARLARYAFLAKVAATLQAQTVAVAHHADDQVETVLMNLIRGAGLEGLRAMMPVSPYPLSGEEIRELLGQPLDNQPSRLVRPLFAVWRPNILAYLRQRGLAGRDDPTNRDPRFLRNRVRHQLLPILEQENPRFREALWRTSQLVADELAALELLADQAWREAAATGSSPVRFRLAAWQKLPAAVQRRLLRRAVGQWAPKSTFGWEHIEAMRLALSGQPPPGLPAGLRLHVDQGEFWFAAGEAPPPPRLGPEAIPLPEGGRICLPGGWAIRVRRGEAGTPPPAVSSPWMVLLDPALLGPGLAVRGRRAGDRIAPAGMGGRHRRIQDIFVDHRVPRAERDGWPLLVVGEEVIWVPGLRLAERARAPSAGQPWIHVTVEPPARLNVA